MKWHGTQRTLPRKPNWEVPESNGIAARIRRAERMNMDQICRIWSKPVKDMTDAESAVMEFFLRYHPDAFTAIESHCQSS